MQRAALDKSAVLADQWNGLGVRDDGGAGSRAGIVDVYTCMQIDGERSECVCVT